MPELVEVKLTSEFINHNSKNRKFTSVYKVLNNNQIVEKINLELEPFQIISESNGKELTLSLKDSRAEKKIWVFMGMTGNFEFIETKNWNKNKFTRLRIDSEDGFSLVMFGGFMGPKFSLQKFKSKRGPDLTKDFNSFKNNILNNLNNIDFKKPLPEVLLNQKWFNGIGAYLTSEILGRLDFDPHKNFNQLKDEEIILLLDECKKCCEESYNLGGGAIKDWKNPFGESRIKDWLLFYDNKKVSHRHKFGTRNIWIKNKYKKS